MIFLGKFLLTYLVLTFIYQAYLEQFDGKANEVDGMTLLVAEHSRDLSLMFNYNAKLVPNLEEPAMNFYYNDTMMARIIEGCNGLSVIILFISFVIAFSGRKRTTFLFLIGGSLLIYLLNVVRIALLCILMYYFPEQEHILHGVLFPLFIYGVVFMLWIIWVNKFSKYATETIKS